VASLAMRDELFTSDPVSQVLYPDLQESTAISDQVSDWTARAVQLCRRTWTQWPLAEGSNVVPGIGLWSRWLLRTDDQSLILLETMKEEAIADAEPPAWVVEVVPELLRLQSLPRDWDSYGGLPVDEAHASTAWRFLESVMSENLPLPDLVPLPDGGIQLEWDQDGTQLSFTAEPGSPQVLWLSTPAGDREVTWDELPALLEKFKGATA
jgi:hypothetical protein